MTDHYEALDIPRDATPDHIRKAYKQKASASHPDRQGGDGSAMAAINAARDCLMDEQRRIQYDLTGEDGPESSVVEEAHAALASLFDKAIESDAVDLVAFVRKELTTIEAQLVSGVQNRTQRVRILKKRRGRVKAKGDANIVHVLIDRKIQAAEREMAAMSRGAEVMRAARDLALDYEHVPDETAVPPRPQANIYGELGGLGFARWG